MAREAYVIGGGMLDGIKENGKNALAHPEQSVPAFVLSTIIGGAMAYAQKKPGAFRLGAKVVGAAFTVGFVKDLLDPERLSGIGSAVSDTWYGRGSLSENRAKINVYAGQFAFDTAFMAVGGGLGAGSVAYGRARGWSPSYFREKLSEGSSKLASSFSLRHERALSLSLGAVSDTVPAVGRRHLPAMEMFPEGMNAAPTRASMVKLDLQGKPRPLSEQERVLYHREGKSTLEWKPSEETIRVRHETEKFVQQIMKGDYEGALKTAMETEVMQSTELNPARRKSIAKINAEDLNNPQQVMSVMGEMSGQAQFKWQQRTQDGHIGSMQLDVTVPRPIIKLKDGGVEVALVDFTQQGNVGFKGPVKVEYPTTTTSGAPLTKSQIAEIEAIRKSEVGQRMIGETALFAFEESLVHANQHYTAYGKIMSPTFARYSRDFHIKHDTRPQMLHFAGLTDKMSSMREIFMEQEVPMMLYDAGMPLSMIRHHFFFGNRHMQERTPIMNYLEAREAGKNFFGAD